MIQEKNEGSGALAHGEGLRMQEKQAIVSATTSFPFFRKALKREKMEPSSRRGNTAGKKALSE